MKSSQQRLHVNLQNQQGVCLMLILLKQSAFMHRRIMDKNSCTFILRLDSCSYFSFLKNNANSSRSVFYQKYYAKYFPLQRILSRLVQIASECQSPSQKFAQFPHNRFKTKKHNRGRFQSLQTSARQKVYLFYHFSYFIFQLDIFLPLSSNLEV